MKKIIVNSVKHYEKKIKRYGNNYKGMDWPNKKGQYLRFEELIRHFDCSNFTILDVGCGNGEFLNYLIKKKVNFNFFLGLDISEKMILLCKKNYTKIKKVNFQRKDILKEKTSNFDYVFASGIFNIKNNVQVKNWEKYVYKMIKKMFDISKYGVAFNIMTFDTSYRNKKMYYQSIDKLVSFLRKKVTKKILINHSYDLWEYTVYLFKRNK